MAKSLHRAMNGDTIDANSAEKVMKTDLFGPKAVVTEASIPVPIRLLENERRFIIGRLRELNRLLGYTQPHVGDKIR